MRLSVHALLQMLSYANAADAVSVGASVRAVVDALCACVCLCVCVRVRAFGPVPPRYDHHTLYKLQTLYAYTSDC